MAPRFAAVVACAMGLLPPAPAVAIDLEVRSVAYVEIKGVIRDGRTNAPLEDARVYATWTAVSYGGYGRGTSVCLRFAAGKSDSQGRFSIVTPEWAVFRPGLAQQFVDIRIHKAGWQEMPDGDSEDGRAMKLEEEKVASAAALSQGGILAKRRIGVDARLFPAREDANDRLRRLRSMTMREPRCENRGEDRPIQEYFEAIASEAQALAKTKYEKALADLLASRASRALAKDHVDEEGEDWFRKVTAYLDPEDLESRSSQGDATALMGWAGAGNAAEVRRLLGLGANPNRTRGRGDSDSALTTAMKQYGWANVNRPPDGAKYLAVIQALLADPRTNPDLRGAASDYTPLMRALEYGQDDVVELLLKAGANPNLTAYNRQFSALSIASKRAATGQNGAGVPMPGAARQFDLLLASPKLDRNMVSTYDGNTPLTGAISGAYAEVARKLLEAGADPNAPNHGKLPPLIVATEHAILNESYRRKEYVDTVRLLAAWPGVRHDVVVRGKTALQMARDARRQDLVEILQAERR